MNDWIANVLKSAGDDFVRRCLEGEGKLEPITRYETDLLRRGQEEGKIAFDGSWISSPARRRYSLFTFNREYLTHFAAWCELAFVLGYCQDDIHVEYQNLDLAVIRIGEPTLAVEVKRSAREAENLEKEMMKWSGVEIPTHRDRGMDGLRKIKCLHKTRFPEFWILNPEGKTKFTVSYDDRSVQIKLIERQSHLFDSKISATA